jgi:threonine/homoserine/homoserine lactone efflux protein
MNLSIWILFAAVALAAILTPGPAVFLAITNSVTFGWRRVVFSSLGNVLGLLVISSVTMLGLGALLKASATVFTGFKLVGAGYLIFLGIKQWRTQSNVFTQAAHVAVPGQDSHGRLFRQGLGIALTNPKAILFFSALFPQFIRPQQAVAPQFMILTGTFMSFSFVVLMSYGLLAHTARTWLACGHRATWFNRVSGSIFLVLGVGMLRIKASQT